jgi:hypothetical protein
MGAGVFFSEKGAASNFFFEKGAVGHKRLGTCGLDSWFADVSKVVSLTRRPRSVLQKRLFLFLVHISVSCGWKDYENRKKSMTSSDLEPATFRLVE